ncbi:hypothetical protein LSH36_474g01048 [Paralvinella palmiformis]|uniref:Cadherin domain-containing protein n=1 Tax=Paralvinella palmiformis TaxID=53620 RepID=A0AAD9MZ09_9ANNE|nr:hypothetical protein LSH36_474g01048 [Paralvinella palmiformis]
MAARSKISLIFHLGILSLLTLDWTGRLGTLAQRSTRTRDLTARFEIVEESPGQSYVGNVAIGAGLDKVYNATVRKTLEFGFIPQPGHDTEFFRIESDTGILRTSRPIDRDTKCPGRPDCHINIAVAIMKPVEFFQLISVTVSLLDVNDNSPAFSPNEYGIRFSESDPVGTGRSLPIALDRDSPRFGVRDYTMVTEVAEFRLEKNTNPGSGLTDLKLVLVEPLDRELVDTYMVIVEAVDGGTPPKTGSLLIDVAVEDDNDHTPQFQNDSYAISVREDFPVNTTFFTVHAVDPDAGDNGKVAYTFDPLTASLYGSQFRIERYTGAISLKKTLDYETANAFHLQVAAADMAPNSRSTLAQIELGVIDVNDNYPEITISTLTDSEVASVRENLPERQFVGYVSVFDSDVGENGDVLCDLSHQSFDMVPISKNQYKIVTTESLDREAVGSHILKVLCYDMGDPSLSTSRDLTVEVADDNDHSPVFHPSQYAESIRENNMVDAYILRLNATDSDTGRNAQLEYRIVEPIVSKYVYVQRQSGVIRAARVLDFEQIQMIEFTVSVADRGEPPRSASAFVAITILDTNDEAPRFSYPHYSFSVLENQDPDVIVGQVTAFDLDSAPYNVLEYSISPRYHDDQGSFDIDTISGEILAMAPLDREQRSVYYLTAFASDVDNPSLISSASVTVYVNDENDNFPMITFPQENNRTFEVSADAPIGYNVTRIVVEDADIGDNARISYSILSGDDGGIFAVDPDVGVVSVTQDLSAIGYAEFWIRIIVQDHGTPVKADTVDVLLIVDSSLPYYPASGRGQGIVRNGNLTIIIVVSAVSGFIIVILIIAIALLKMLDRRRFHGKEYNCRNEEQKILNDLNIKAVEANGNLQLQERGTAFGSGKDTGRMTSGRGKNSLDRNKQVSE